MIVQGHGGPVHHPGPTGGDHARRPMTNDHRPHPTGGHGGGTHKPVAHRPMHHGPAARHKKPGTARHSAPRIPVTAVELAALLFPFVTPAAC